MVSPARIFDFCFTGDEGCRLTKLPSSSPWEGESGFFTFFSEVLSRIVLNEIQALVIEIRV